MENLGSERLKQEASDSQGYELRVTTSKNLQRIVRDIAPLNEKGAHYVIPVDIKNGILNLPSRTRERKLCKVLPSNGSAPHTSTYNTTPRL